MIIDYRNGEDASSVGRFPIPFCVVNLMPAGWEQAEEVGAQLITGIRVDNVVQRDGKSWAWKPMAIYSGSQSRDPSLTGEFCWLKSWAWLSVLRHRMLPSV